jgi:opacity protein-like surface antigen
MKKIIASAGLIAISATGLKAQYAPGLSRMETSKPWSISASLRGFYDDNYLAVSDDAEESFGFEVRPRIAFNLPREQTYIGGAYTYGLKYYEARDDDEFDQTHEVDLKVDHRFSERLKISLNDSFVYAQEPEVIEGSGGTITTFRTESDVFRNRASVDLRAQATELFGVGFGYENGWYDYQDDDDPGSRSALLDRLEHTVRLDGLWQARPNLVGIVGYQLGINSYTADELLVDYGGPAPANALSSDDRDSMSHFGYVGAEYTLSEELSFAGRVGIEYIDYTELDDTETSPFADVSGTYRYVPGSYVQFGVRHRHNPTDVASGGTEDNVTLDQETTTVYGSVHHKITARIAANLMAQYQRSEFVGGDADGDLENFFLAGINLQYEITQNWSAEAGYNYDRLDADDAGRNFTRNRIYAGVRLQY